MLAVRFHQPLLQIDKFLLFAGELLLHLGASSVGLTDFISEGRQRRLLIGESFQLYLKLRLRRLTARLTLLEVLLQTVDPVLPGGQFLLRGSAQAFERSHLGFERHDG